MPAWLAALNPGWLMILAGLIALVVPYRQARQALTIGTPVVAIILLALAPHEVDLASANALGIPLSFYRVDSLNFIFGLGFLIAALLNGVYALHTDNARQDGMALAYAGAAVSAVFAGDLMTLFIFWEITAITSVFLVLQAGTRAAYFASMRYLTIQVLSGVILLNGLAYVWNAKGTLSLDAFQSFNDPGALLIFIAFGIKAAFPFMHNWLQDAYPKASVVGAVVLAAFTTKMAIYGFIRLFPGFDALIWIGAIMAVFPLVLALLEDDLRRVLAYALNSQLGFMICAVGVGVAGVGSPLAINGVSAHAFASTLYMAVLFMAIGGVLYRTGTSRISELGGLYRSMPWTTLFCIIGAFSISAFPLFSGFAAKSQSMSALAAEPGAVAAWLALMFSSAAVLVHAGLRVPFATFFSRDSGKRVKEAPFNMLLAMGIGSFFCLALGLPALFSGFGYQWLYGLLPYPIEAAAYQPYTLGHVITQLQLLVLAAFAFVLLRRFGLYPSQKPGLLLDTDWLYRKAGFGAAQWAGTVWGKLGPAITAVFANLSVQAYKRLESAFSPRGEIARGGLSGGATIWTAVILAAILLLSFLAG